MIDAFSFNIGRKETSCWATPKRCRLRRLSPEGSTQIYVYIFTYCLAGYSIYGIHVIKRCIPFRSCQVLSPSETGFIVSAHRLPNITLLTLIATL